MMTQVKTFLLMNEYIYYTIILDRELDLVSLNLPTENADVEEKYNFSEILA